MAQNQNFSSSEQPCCRKGSIQKLWIKTSKFRICSVLHSCKKSNQVRERERARKRERERERERKRNSDKKLTRTLFPYCYKPKRIQNHSLTVMVSKSKAFITWSTEAQKKRSIRKWGKRTSKSNSPCTPKEKNNQIWAEKEKKIQYYNPTRGVYASQYETSKGPRTTLTLTRAIFANVHELSYKSAIKTGSKSQFVIAWATTKATKNSDRKL